MQPAVEKFRQGPEESTTTGHWTIKEQLVSILTPLVQTQQTVWKSELHAWHGDVAS